MMKNNRLIRRDESGSTIVEAAFVLPIFFFLTFAIIELSIIFFYSFVMEGAMFDATRYAKIAPDARDVAVQIRDELEKRSFGMLDPDRLFITTDLTETADYSAENEECVDEKGAIIEDQFCPCAPNSYNDRDKNGVCGLPLRGGAPGAITEYLAFYQHELLTPYLDEALGEEEADGSNSQIYTIVSATVVRNEPVGTQAVGGGATGGAN